MRYLLIILLSFSATVTMGSKALESIDSLKIELENAKSEERVEILLDISETSRFVNTTECYKYGMLALDEAKKLNNSMVRAKVLKSIAVSNYFDGKLDNAIEYTNKALEIFKSLEDKEGLAACYNNTGLFYEEKGEADLALYNYEKSFYYEKLRGDKLGMAYSYLTIGNAYYYKDELISAINNYFKSLKLMQEINNENGMAKLYNVIGVIYEDSKEYDKALEYYNKAEEVFTKLGNTEDLGRIYMNLGELYSLESKKYKVALEYFNKALSIKKEFDDKTGLALVYNNFGYLFGYMEDYETALDYLNKSYNIYSEVDSKNGLVMVEYNLGVIYNKIHKTNLSIKHLQSSLNLVNEYGFNDYKMPVYEELLKIYAVGKPNKELFNENFELYTNYKDSVIEKLKLTKLREVEAKFDTQKLVYDTNKLIQENQERVELIYPPKMWFLFIGGILFLIFLIYIFFFRNKL